MTKEITKDIFLEKELLSGLGKGEPIYIFKLITKSTKGISYIADFTGSTNVLFIEVFGRQDKLVFTG